jgi:hypothetical protein
MKILKALEGTLIRGFGHSYYRRITWIKFVLQFLSFVYLTELFSFSAEFCFDFRSWFRLLVRVDELVYRQDLDSEVVLD